MELKEYPVIDIRTQAPKDKIVVIAMSKIFSDYSSSEKVWYGQDLESFDYKVYNDVIFGNVHPYKCIDFAKNLLIKYKNKGIIILTFNPYLIESIETFALRFKMEEQIIWLKHKGDINSEFECYKLPYTKLEYIYQDFAEPFQILENIKWSKDDEFDLEKYEWKWKLKKQEETQIKC